MIGDDVIYTRVFRHVLLQRIDYMQTYDVLFQSISSNNTLLQGLLSYPIIDSDRYRPESVSSVKTLPSGRGGALAGGSWHLALIHSPYGST